MTKKLQEIEDLLRNGKPPDKNFSRLRHNVWEKVVTSQRERRGSKLPMNLHPWILALTSIVIVLIFIVMIFFLK